MFQSVLLPIDLGHPSSWTRALPTALDLVRASGGTLHVLSVVPDFGMSMVSDYFPADFEEKALAKANADIAAFAQANVPSDITHQTHLGHGSISGQILETATNLRAEIIVMASHKADGVRGFLIGSNAERVVRHASISVLVVRG